MEDFRSKSCTDGRMQIESYYGGVGPTSIGPTHDFRCYRASYTSSSSTQPPPLPLPEKEVSKDVKFKKGKSVNGSSVSTKSWSFSDPEMQRKRRVASYKVYAVEDKVKGSFRKSFRWLKDRCTQVVYGWR